MIEAFSGAVILGIGVAVGWYVTKNVASIDVKVGDLGLNCYHIDTFDDGKDEDVVTCLNSAVTIRGGNALCSVHEEEFIDSMMSTNAPDDLGDL